MGLFGITGKFYQASGQDFFLKLVGPIFYGFRPKLLCINVGRIFNRIQPHVLHKINGPIIIGFGHYLFENFNLGRIVMDFRPDFGKKKIALIIVGFSPYFPKKLILDGCNGFLARYYAILNGLYGKFWAIFKEVSGRFFQ